MQRQIRSKGNIINFAIIHLSTHSMHRSRGGSRDGGSEAPPPPLRKIQISEISIVKLPKYAPDPPPFVEKLKYPSEPRPTMKNILDPRMHS